MGDLISKLSSYNIFNYLLPGIVYVAIISMITDYNLQQENLLIAGFLYYFIGLVISRIGSLVVEPVAKKCKIVVFSPYKDFVKASASDSKLEILSEANNTYRTLSALFLVILVTKLFEIASERWEVSSSGTSWALLLGLLALFICAFRKQSNYIKERVEHMINDKGEQ